MAHKPDIDRELDRDEDGDPVFVYQRDCPCDACTIMREQHASYRRSGFVELGRLLSEAIAEAGAITVTPDLSDAEWQETAVKRRRLVELRKGAAKALANWLTNLEPLQ